MIAIEHARPDRWVEEMIEAAVQKTVRPLAPRDLALTVAALGERLNRIREFEAERFRYRLRSLSPEQRDAVDGLTRAILNKILHGAITELESEAGTPAQGAIVNVARRVFGLASSD